jgi:RND family efflux transporter MFP subunit
MTTTVSQRTRTLPVRWLVVGLVLIVATLLAAIAINNRPAPGATGVGATVPATRGAIIASVGSSGTVSAAQTMALTFHGAGTVTEVLVAEGDSVEAGQVLVRLDDRALQLQLEEARLGLQRTRITLAALRDRGPTTTEVSAAMANLRSAELRLEQLQEAEANEAEIASAEAALYQARASLATLTSGAAASDVELQEAGVEQAALAVQRAELALENSVLTAPFDGIVTQVNVEPGSGTGGAAPPLTLMDRSTLYVDLRLNENDVARVRIGQPATVQVDALRPWQAEGTVTTIAPAAEVVSGVVTYGVRVSFADDDPDLRVGMTATLDIVTDQKEDALLVPTTALLPKGAGYVVQVVETDGGVPTEVGVQIGLSDGVMTEIVSGLTVGQQVVALPSEPRPTRGGPFGN